MHGEWLLEFPSAARPALEAYISGAAAPETALMHVLMAVHSQTEARQLLERAARTARDRAAPEVARRLEQLRRLAAEHPDAWQLVADTLEHVDGSSAGSSVDSAEGSAGGTDLAARSLAQLATRFDRAAEHHPEASVALYSLGDPALLEAATAELVRRLRDWGLLSRDGHYLDLGCGIGRIEQALSPQVGFITGIDISPKMIEHARARCAEAQNVAFQLTSGRDLGGFADSSIDVILAVDCFPYLTRCGALLAERHFSESARVLKQGGQLAIFNFSYAGDLGADRSELERLAASYGLAVLRNGVQGLQTWDGAGFQLKKK